MSGYEGLVKLVLSVFLTRPLLTNTALDCAVHAVKTFRCAIGPAHDCISYYVIICARFYVICKLLYIVRLLRL